MGDFGKLSTLGEGEDEEVALAGGDNGEEAAVGGDGEVAEGEAVEDGCGNGLAHGDVLVWGVGRYGREGREIDPDQVAGFFFDGAFQEDTGFVGGPLKQTETNTHAGDAIRCSQVAHLKNFLVNVVGDCFCAGGNGDAAFVAVEGGEFFVVLGEEVEPLEARRAGKIAVALDGNGNVGARDVVHVKERAAVERGANGARRNVDVFEGKENMGLHDLGEIDDGGIVEEPTGIGGILDDAVEAAEADFFAVVLEDQGHESVFGFAGFVDDGSGE